MAGAPDSSSPIYQMKAAHSVRYTFDSGGNPTYIGLAQTGVATSSADWQIRRITWSTGLPTKIEYADGDDKFNNIWDNHASLNYS